MIAEWEMMNTDIYVQKIQWRIHCDQKVWLDEEHCEIVKFEILAVRMKYDLQNFEDLTGRILIEKKQNHALDD